VAANSDGSSRVVVRNSMSYGRNDPERAAVAAFDVMPDGQVKQVSSFSPRVNVRAIFPLLPPDKSAAAASWKTPAQWDGTVTTFTAAAKSGDANTFTFDGVDDGPTNRIYVSTQKNTVYFDRVKGIVTGGKSEYSQKWGFNQTGTTALKLDKDETIDAAKAVAIGKDYDAYFSAQREYTELFEGVNEHPERAGVVSGSARAVLDQAAKKITEPEVAGQMQELVKNHDTYAKYSRDEAERIAGVLNKPAKDFSAKDYDGKSWSLADLKGKVVVMDFWYRGCGWCMYAMPQVKQLATDYKDKPVVVLGMNTDAEESDAKFVVKELGLEYPQVKAEGLPQQFGVQGFPTLIVIDQAGVVRTFHVGYAHDLRERIGRQIDALLAKNPAEKAK
jgi:thiol-disulfide isomerase/thioredoxin